MVYLKSFTFVVLALLSQAYSDRIKDQMYIKMSNFGVCFRRMNATHQIGCSSNRNGNTGVVHFCQHERDLDFILTNGTAPPYIPVMNITWFTRQVIQKLKDSDKIVGVLFYQNNTTERPTGAFTHDIACPNAGYGLPNTCEVNWNSHGTGLLFESIPFPVYFIDKANDIAQIKECFSRFNDFDYPSHYTRPLCALEMDGFMNGATSTPTCLRRTDISRKTNLNPARFCDPLGDMNVWTTMSPMVNPNNSQPIRNDKYIILATKIDSTTMFDITHGAESPVTSLVTLLTTAQVLKKILPKESKGKNILLMLFNGETYDYMGSQRVLYDMHLNKFPQKDDSIFPHITVDDIELFIELSQISKTEHLVIHSYKQSEKVKNFTDILNSNKNNVPLTTSDSNVVPPSSLQTFWKDHPDLPGMVLADHMKEYANQYYNSIFDNATNINFQYYDTNDTSPIPNDSVQAYLTDVSDMLAKSIYRYVVGKKYEGNQTADLLLVNELLYCYLQRWNCKVHKAIQKMELSEYQYTYVGVERSTSTFTNLVGYTLGWLIGEDLGPTNETCVNHPDQFHYKLVNMSKSMFDLKEIHCFKVRVNFTPSVSPAFIIPDYDWSSGKYSSWTESTWGELGLRMFVKPSRAHEVLTVAIGSITFALSLVVVYFAKRKSDTLFIQPIIAEAPTNC